MKVVKRTLSGCKMVKKKKYTVDWRFIKGGMENGECRVRILFNSGTRLAMNLHEFLSEYEVKLSTDKLRSIYTKEIIEGQGAKIRSASVKRYGQTFWANKQRINGGTVYLVYPDVGNRPDYSNMEYIEEKLFKDIFDMRTFK